MSVSHVPSPHSYHVMSTVSEGLMAGLLAGLSIIGVFFAYDLGFSDVFRTPSVLNAYLWGGAEAAQNAIPSAESAIAYSVVHLSAWLVVGVLAAFAVTRTDRSRRAWYVVTIVATTLLCGAIALGSFWEVPGLGADVLWVGALIGGIVFLGYFGWRHPHLIQPAE